MERSQLGEVWFEFVRAGNVVKVSAVHVASDTEICIVAPLNAPEAVMKAAALRRLEFVLGKNSGSA